MFLDRLWRWRLLKIILAVDIVECALNGLCKRTQPTNTCSSASDNSPYLFPTGTLGVSSSLEESLIMYYFLRIGVEKKEKNECAT
jgi:hypothetical protein